MELPRRAAASQVNSVRVLRSWSWVAAALFVAALALPAAAQTDTLFIRGDVNADGGLDVSDPVSALLHLFAGGTAPDCLDSADVDDDGTVTLSDAVGLLGYLFTAGERPRPPFPSCGPDPTADSLACQSFPCSPPNPEPQITEWTVPWPNTRPRDPYVDPLHPERVWFVGQRDDYAAYLEPANGTFTRFELLPGSGPHNLIVSDVVWYAGNGDGHIGKLDPASGGIQRFNMPDAAADDPHTLIFDSSGDIWFTVQSGNFAGKLTTSTGAVRLVRIPTANSRPYGIDLDSTQTPWIVLFGTNKVARVDRDTFAVREFTLPRSATRPRRIAVTSDDLVWYVDYAQGYLGRLDPTTGAVQEWRSPAGSSAGPYGMASDHLDRLWYVETGVQPNRLIGFDPAQGEFVSTTAIPSGGLVVRHLHFDAPTRTLWFGTDRNTIARARLEP
jgi:virginiamycin B lyase